MSTANYHCEAQQRVLKVLMGLFGHEIDGLSPSQMAKGLGIKPAQITRDLWNLEAAGLVERLPGSDRARISPRLGSKALATLAAFDQAQKQLTDLQQRYTRAL
jgi:DNA-binding MarR family transcriptional regulator